MITTNYSCRNKERNRVVHSVMMIRAKADNERFYEAWNARSDETASVPREACAVSNKPDCLHFAAACGRLSSLRVGSV